jgi:putative protein-disulfide isomerase
MNTATLHYVYDPFCGWCYGAAPMISAAQEIPGLEIEAHGIGMLSGDKSKRMSAAWRDFVRPHEARITAFSKQTFADAYVHGVLDHEDVLLDSSLPIAAMLAAQQLSGRGLEMLKRLQLAYYQEGRAIADRAVIGDVAMALGHDREAFMAAFDDIAHTSLDSHLRASKDMLDTLKLQGVPSFVLDVGGRFEILPLGHYLGRPHRFKEAIEAHLLERISEERA